MHLSFINIVRVLLHKPRPLVSSGSLHSPQGNRTQASALFVYVAAALAMKINLRSKRVVMQEKVPAVTKIRSVSSPCARKWNCFKKIIIVGSNCCLDAK